MNKNVNKKAVLAAAILGIFSVAPFVVTEANAQTRGSQWPSRDSRDNRGSRDHRDSRDNRNDRTTTNRTYPGGGVFGGRTDNRSYPGNNRYDPRNRDNRTLEGLVTQDRRGDDFIMRLNNGQRVWVRANNTPRRLSEGDLVRVRGHFVDSDRNNGRYSGRWDDRHVFRGENVQIIRDRNNNNYGGGYVPNNGNNRSYNADFNFPAIVMDSNRRLNTLRVRGENGREYVIRSNEAGKWDRNDRVGIQGTVRNGVMVATDIDKR